MLDMLAHPVSSALGLAVLAGIVWLWVECEAFGKVMTWLLLALWGAVAVVGPLAVILGKYLPNGDYVAAAVTTALALMMAIPWVYVVWSIMRWPRPAFIDAILVRRRRPDR